MDTVYLVLAFVAVGGVFYGLYHLLGRTPRNPDSTHGGGLSGDPTGGTGGVD